ncbi:hypothetical protein H0H81_002390 [Sphagnurus paluster]|uniref:AMP-activated protein kinase glycogen-binding domain-containing protein n=1 Tax=Sphagnurus paluster TaxID=117069 RepID=A0A9P7GN42_9AGAR|nr:hypothetical protein H0H81_002390 [Sphagnurus paluster]
MTTSQHEVLFKWQVHPLLFISVITHVPSRPSTDPSEVIVAGDFNQWARTYRLKKGPDGFVGSTHVPWGSTTSYKYIVDGTWLVHPAYPTRYDGAWNLNNVYSAPPAPPTAGKDLDATRKRTSNWRLVVDLADTVVARDGTTSALEYVASGIGAAIHGVVGVDPVNGEKLAVPTSLPTAETDDGPTPSTSVGASAGAEAPVIVESPSTGPAPAPTLATVPTPSRALSSTPEPIPQIAPLVPITIVRVNAPENNTIPREPSILVRAPAPEKDQEKHAEGNGNGHSNVYVNGNGYGNGNGNEYSNGHANGNGHPPVLQQHDSDLAPIESVLAVPEPTPHAEETETDDTLASSPSADEMPIPQRNPAADHEPEHLPIDTPQVRTPDSGLDPSSVTVPGSTHGGAAAAAAAILAAGVAEDQVDYTSTHVLADVVQEAESAPAPMAEPSKESEEAVPASATLLEDSETAKEYEIVAQPPAPLEEELTKEAQDFAEPTAPVQESAQAPQPVADIQHPSVEEPGLISVMEAAPASTTITAQPEGEAKVEKESEIVAEPSPPTQEPKSVTELEPTPVAEPESAPIVAKEPADEPESIIRDALPVPQAQPLPVEESTPSADVKPILSPEQVNGTSDVIPATTSTTNERSNNGHVEPIPSFPTPPVTPPRAKPRPQEVKLPDSPLSSPSSSPAGTMQRKKKRSLFGKIRHIFDSDKDKAKAKK